MGTLMEKWFGFYLVREELEARISGLENEKTKLEREMVRLKSLEGIDKSELDLQNMRFASENRKLKEENITLKKQLSKLQQQKPQ